MSEKQPQQQTEQATARRVEPMDPELMAMKKIGRILSTLNPDAQLRVIRWATSKAESALYAKHSGVVGIAVERSNGASAHPHG